MIVNRIILVFKKIKAFIRNNFIFKFYLNLLKIVVIHKINRSYKNVLRIKRKKIATNKKLKVAFFVTQKQLWCAQSVYDELSKSEYFEPIIVAFPNGEDSVHSKEVTCQDNYNYFSIKKMSVIMGYNYTNNKFLGLNEIDVDIIFYDQPYPWLPKRLLWEKTSKHALICYIPYGYKVAKCYQSHFNMDLQNMCWSVFAESEWHKDQFVKYGVIKGGNVIVSGYPKLDVYNESNAKINQLWKTTDVRLKQKRIIWAPHWSIFNNSIKYSTFNFYYQLMLDYAKQHKNISWIFKPHQRLRYYLEEINFMTRKDIDAYYQEWQDLPNGCIYNGTDYFDIFKSSDALITDCGSFLAEYLPSMKPVLVPVRDDSIGYNEIGTKIVSTYYKANDWYDIKNFIEEVVIQEKDDLKDERLSVMQYVQPNTSGAGKFIVDYFEKEIRKKIRR